MSSEFEYEALRRVIDTFAVGASERSAEELAASLRERGYDPASFAAKLQQQVREYRQKRRLAWMNQADQHQAELDRLLTGLVSWLTKPAHEVEQAFRGVLEGRFGQEAQLRVATAFRNAEHLPHESKAAFLDEIQTLIALSQRTSSSKSE
jgi:hypothetical protein